MTEEHAREDAGRLARLGRIAAAVGRSAPRRKPGWPCLWLFTDPDRTPDPLAAAALLPPGSGVVLRTFGRHEVEALAPPLAALCRHRRLVLLVGRDAALAKAIGADGVHLPERELSALPRLRARYPRWRFTAAAHSPTALRAATFAGADAAFLSPVLPSESPSAGPAIGVLRAQRWVSGSRLPVYALGGVDEETARGLVGRGFSGVAGVGFASRRA